MDSVVTLLADPRARLCSPQAIGVLREQLHSVDGVVAVSDVRSALTDVWEALVVVAEAGDGDEEVVAVRRLVVVLDEMLCSPIQMPLHHRQCYWELLQCHLRRLSRTSGYEKALQRVDYRFPRWMDSLHTGLWRGRIRPVTAPSKLLSRNRRRTAEEELTQPWRSAASGTSYSVPNEAQYLGNASDHWRMHTSHR